jgi:hypothetical protein
VIVVVHEHHGRRRQPERPQLLDEGSLHQPRQTHSVKEASSTSLSTCALLLAATATY